MTEFDEVGEYFTVQSVCPKCKSEDLTNEQPEENNLLECYCLTCGYGWVEPYENDLPL